MTRAIPPYLWANLYQIEKTGEWYFLASYPTEEEAARYCAPDGVTMRLSLEAPPMSEAEIVAECKRLEELTGGKARVWIDITSAGICVPIQWTGVVELFTGWAQPTIRAALELAEEWIVEQLAARGTEETPDAS